MAFLWEVLWKWKWAWVTLALFLTLSSECYQGMLAVGWCREIAVSVSFTRCQGSCKDSSFIWGQSKASTTSGPSLSSLSWLPRLLRYLPFVQHCIVPACPRLYPPSALPLGSCNSVFCQKPRRFHQHLIEFLCIQYLIQKAEYFTEPTGTSVTYTHHPSSLGYSESDGLGSTGCLGNSLARRTQEPRGLPGCSLDGPPPAWAGSFLSFLWVFFLSHLGLSLSALSQKPLCHQLIVSATDNESYRVLEQKLCIFFLL